jgi:hypothetical protein
LVTDRNHLNFEGAGDIREYPLIAAKYPQTRGPREGAERQPAEGEALVLPKRGGGPPYGGKPPEPVQHPLNRGSYSGAPDPAFALPAVGLWRAMPEQSERSGSPEGTAKAGARPEQDSSHKVQVSRGQGRPSRQ